MPTLSRLSEQWRPYRAVVFLALLLLLLFALILPTHVPLHGAGR